MIALVRSGVGWLPPSLSPGRTYLKEAAMTLWLKIIILMALTSTLTAYVVYWQTVAKYEERIRNIQAVNKRMRMHSVR